jgi:transposase
MQCVVNNTELSSLEETRSEFNRSKATIKLGIDVHQQFYVVAMQEGGSNPKPPQRFQKDAFLHWAAKLKSRATEVHAVYEACGFGFGLQRQLSALGVHCHMVCPQKLDEQNRRVKTDGLDAKALCLKLDRFVEGNRDALVNHGIEPVQRWWKPRAFALLAVPEWMRQLLSNSQPILLALEDKIRALSVQLQSAATSNQPRGLGAMTSIIIDREIGNWTRFANRRQVGSYTGLCPSEYSSGNSRLQRCVTKHGNPRLRAALVELAWRLVRFQPNYKPVKKWRRVLAKGALATGAARKKAIVAVARQLAVDLWRIRTGRLSTDQLGLTI